jgi:hypothetical protein
LDRVIFSGANPAIRCNLLFFLKEKNKRISTTIGAKNSVNNKLLVKKISFLTKQKKTK